MRIVSIRCYCNKMKSCLRYTSKRKRYFMNAPPNMHAARSALNQNPNLRKWVEGWLKSRERSVEVAMSDEEFEKHWLYVRPERMHEGAMEALAAYAASPQDE